MGSNHDGHLFDFPGRAFAYELADLDDDAPVIAALRAITAVVEPTVVEAITEDGEIHHLVGDDKRGGMYKRRLVSEVANINSDALIAWYGSLDAVETLNIGDGWFRVTATPGATVRLLDEGSVVVVEYDGAAVRAPGESILVPPIRFDFDVVGGKLTLDLSWSHWTDADGVGRRQFDELRAAITRGGWKLRREPDAAALVWRRQTSVVALPIASDSEPRRDAPAVEWTSIAAQRVTLGLTPTQRETLADALLVADRAADESEESLGYGEYNAAKRRAEIEQALAVSLGHEDVDVRAFEIMQRPVSNAMWTAYMKTTGASAPAGWNAALPPDAPMLGVSQAEAAAFAVHHGWALPSEAEWQLAEAVIAPQHDGTSEYTTNLFAPYRGGDPAAFTERGQICARGSAAKLPPCIPARRGLARNHRFKFARFRCVR